MFQTRQYQIKQQHQLQHQQKQQQQLLQQQLQVHQAQAHLQQMAGHELTDPPVQGKFRFFVFSQSHLMILLLSNKDSQFLS